MTPAPLLTAIDLAALLGLSVHTVRILASRAPERLPPRIAAMRVLRWSPDAYRAWINGTPPVRPRTGRPRKEH